MCVCRRQTVKERESGCVSSEQSRGACTIELYVFGRGTYRTRACCRPLLLSSLLYMYEISVSRLFSQFKFSPSLEVLVEAPPPPATSSTTSTTRSPLGSFGRPLTSKQTLFQNFCTQQYLSFLLANTAVAATVLLPI